MIQTAAYYLAFVVVGMTTASFGPGLPFFSENTGASLAQVGALFVFHRIGYIAGSLGGGRLIDRLPGNRVTGITLLLISGGLVSVSAASLLPVLLGSILILGLAQGTTEVGSNTGVVRLHGDKAGPVMNGLHLSFGIGAMAAPLVLAAALDLFGGMRTGYWFLAILAAGAGVWVLRLSDSEHLRRGEEHTVVRGPFRVVPFVAALLFFTIAGEAGFAGWLYSYAVRTGMAAERLAGFLTSAFWAALTVGRFVGIDLVRRLGARRLLLVNTAGAMAAAGLFLVFPGKVGVLWAVILLLGFSQASIIPAAFTLSGELKILSGVTAGVFIASSSAGGMIFPWLIGRFFESAGRPLVFVYLVFLSQAAAFLSYLCVGFAAGRRA